MSKKITKKTLDGNTAVAKIAYKLSETVAIYPITPSSPMGEVADELAAQGEKNIFGTIPQVEEMQSEAGAAGALHGMLQTGSLASTFTASQGLLLMIPNMYKIAGELTPCVFHVAARSLAAQGLSIFGDHQDVMATRATGFAMLASASVQEAQDMALVAHLATLKSRIPFMHFFDGFRTSHEVNKIELIDDSVIKKLVDEKLVFEHRKRGLNPENPFIRGTAQNPDVYFQGRESVNKFYNDVPEIVQDYMDQMAKLIGRQYHLFDYYGDKKAERIIIIIGSGGSAIKETVEYLNKFGEKVGVIQVRLYRPFSVKHLFKVLPTSVKKIAVLDRTKEPGSLGEPLYQDVVNAIFESDKTDIKVIGGRYGLSSKEFTPAMVKAIYDELGKKQPKNHFTIGINDDVTKTSIDFDKNFVLEHKDTKTAIFFGLGSDGTVGANKNSIKIIGEKDEYYAQAYFVYDSKKAGSVTQSHLRFGKKPIDSTYLIEQADFVGCHQFNFMYKMDIAKSLKRDGVLLLNSNFSKDEVWDKLPTITQKQIIAKNAKLYVVDAYEVAGKTGMGSRINTIMQTCFFALADVIKKEEAISKIKESIEKTYGKKGKEIVKKNLDAVDEALNYLNEVNYPRKVTSKLELSRMIPNNAPKFVREFTAEILHGRGDDLPVSMMPVDGTFPSGTAAFEKRGIAEKVATWHSEKCIQCGICSFTCPHSVIRAKNYDKSELKKAPACFQTLPSKAEKGAQYTLDVEPMDCTGCTLCVQACPMKGALTMETLKPIAEERKDCSKFFANIDIKKKEAFEIDNIKSAQLKAPLFEASGACEGCGEISYLKVLTQLFGDRMLVANATGCSSIYGGNLPTTPWSKNDEGRGPAWSNSLFEDNAEFGLGFKTTQEKQREFASELLTELSEKIGADLVKKIIKSKQDSEKEIAAQRKRIEEVKVKVAKIKTSPARHLLTVIDAMLTKSLWIIGGDGWAYDIGFGGLDHVIASGKKVNVMVLDTEVYSNTGGQASKSTPRSAVAKFAATGKKTVKKDLGMILASYGNVYVAQIAIRANPAQALKAIKEAEAHDGPSLIIAYSSCIAHGIAMNKTIDQQKLSVKTGYWPLYRYDPKLKTPMQLDSAEPSLPLSDYLENENRYKVLKKTHPEEAKRLFKLMESDVKKRWEGYKKLANKCE